MAAMGRSIVLWFVIGAVLATAGWLAVQAWHKPPEEGVVMRTYAIRPELAIEIESAVNVAVKPYNASVTRSGQLMVTAPPAYQRGVQELLKEVAAHNPATPPSIRIEAWFVTASPGPHVDSPALKEIEPALHVLEQSKGPMRFDLLEELSMQTQSGQRSSEVSGERTTLSATVSVLRDSQDHPVVASQLKLGSKSQDPMVRLVGTPGISAQTQLRPGELLVLGQSGLLDKGTDRQLYYIVRATL
jgi:hypothetical protein